VPLFVVKPFIDQSGIVPAARRNNLAASGLAGYAFITAHFLFSKL
jgi:hypothetical protein